MADTNDDAYVLHYFPFSLYSLMARFAFVLAERVNPEACPKVDVKLVNMHTEENLSEPFLTRISPRGQVPALTSPALSPALVDSRDISRWLCAKVPELCPPDYTDTIDLLMEKVYAFHARALTVPVEDRKDGIPNQAAAKLENPDISEEYRRALEIKSVYHETVHSRTLEAGNIALVEEKARDFMKDLAETLDEYRGDGTWIFGDRPTIIDAHAAALVARLIDRERDDILVDSARRYAEGVMATEEWHKVNKGRPTMWNPSMGHVKDLEL